MRPYLKYAAYILLTSVLMVIVFRDHFNVTRQVRMTIENDEWEHHSMAVNFAEGHGLFKLGGYDEFGKYHYTTYDYAFPYLRKLHEDFPSEYYHRNIGFSLVAGAIYKMTGNNASVLRIFHLLLILLSWIICIAALRRPFKDLLTPWLVLSTPVLLYFSGPYINVIGDDIYVIFFMSLIFWQITRWKAQPGVVHSVILALLIIGSLVFKSTLILLPALLPIFLFKCNAKKKMTAGIALILILLVSYVSIYSGIVSKRYDAYEPYDREDLNAALMAADWSHADSAYLQAYPMTCIQCQEIEMDYYKKLVTYLFDRQFYGKKSVVLTGQSKYLLIDGNNHHVLTTDYPGLGSWMPTWYFDKYSFYYGYDFETPPFIMVMRYYMKNKQDLLPILLEKLNKGYEGNHLFVALAFFQLFLIFYFRFRGRSRVFLIGSIPVILLMSLYFGGVGSISVLIFLLTSGVLWVRMRGYEAQVLGVLYLFITYFIVLTLILYGLPRYTQLENCFVLAVLIYGAVQLWKDEPRIQATEAKGSLTDSLPAQ